MFHRMRWLPWAWQAHACRVMTYAGVGSKSLAPTRHGKRILDGREPNDGRKLEIGGGDGDTTKARATQAFAWRQERLSFSTSFEKRITRARGRTVS